MCSVTVYKPRTLPPLIRCRTFVLTVTFSPAQSCDALVTIEHPCLPHPLGRLARHRSRVRVGSDTTCHGAITLSLKSRSNGVCSVAVYKPRTLPPLIRCGIFILTGTREEPTIHLASCDINSYTLQLETLHHWFMQGHYMIYM